MRLQLFGMDVVLKGKINGDVSSPELNLQKNIQNGKCYCSFEFVLLGNKQKETLWFSNFLDHFYLQCICYLLQLLNSQGNLIILHNNNIFT